MVAGNTLGGPGSVPRAFFLEHDNSGHEGPGFYWNIVLKRDETPYEALLKGRLAATPKVD